MLAQGPKPASNVGALMRLSPPWERSMSFRITGLDPAPFADLWLLKEEEMAARGVTRVEVQARHVSPCRISLDDAEIGEQVLLLPFEHQSARTAYRQQGPIFVRKDVARWRERGEIPPALARRTLSLRGFNDAGAMIEAELSEGRDAPKLIRRFFDNDEVAYIHAHYARRGCFAALIERA